MCSFRRRTSGLTVRPQLTRCGIAVVTVAFAAILNSQATMATVQRTFVASPGSDAISCSIAQTEAAQCRPVAAGRASRCRSVAPQQTRSYELARISMIEVSTIRGMP